MFGSYYSCPAGQNKKRTGRKPIRSYGAAGRGRTDTVSLPRDFESRASANSTTAAYFVVRTVSGATHANYNNISLIKNQQNLTGKRKFYE